MGQINGGNDGEQGNGRTDEQQSTQRAGQNQQPGGLFRETSRMFAVDVGWQTLQPVLDAFRTSQWTGEDVTPFYPVEDRFQNVSLLVQFLGNRSDERFALELASVRASLQRYPEGTFQTQAQAFRQMVNDATDALAFQHNTGVAQLQSYTRAYYLVVYAAYIESARYPVEVPRPERTGFRVEVIPDPVINRALGIVDLAFHYCVHAAEFFPERGARNRKPQVDKMKESIPDWDLRIMLASLIYRGSPLTSIRDIDDMNEMGRIHREARERLQQIATGKVQSTAEQKQEYENLAAQNSIHMRIALEIMRILHRSVDSPLRRYIP